MGKFTKRTAVIAGISALAISGGAAWAFTGWTIDGEGRANAQAAEIKRLEATSTFKDNVYPGLTATMSTNVNNPNEFPVQLTGTATIKTITVKGGDAGNNCKNGLTAPGIIETVFPGTPVIPANKPDHVVSSNVKFGSIPQACAGKAIEVTYTFSGVSKA